MEFLSLLKPQEKWKREISFHCVPTPLPVVFWNEHFDV